MVADGPFASTGSVRQNSFCWKIRRHCRTGNWLVKSARRWTISPFTWRTWTPFSISLQDSREYRLPGQAAHHRTGPPQHAKIPGLVRGPQRIYPATVSDRGSSAPSRLQKRSQEVHGRAGAGHESVRRYRPRFQLLHGLQGQPNALPGYTGSGRVLLQHDPGRGRGGSRRDSYRGRSRSAVRTSNWRRTTNGSTSHRGQYADWGFTLTGSIRCTIF